MVPDGLYHFGSKYQFSYIMLLFSLVREIPRVPQAVWREAFQGGCKAAPLAHDGQDRSPKLLDDSADGRPASAGAEGGQATKKNTFLLYIRSLFVKMLSVQKRCIKERHRPKKDTQHNKGL